MSGSMSSTPSRTRLVLSPQNRLVTLPPGLYKVRQGPLSHHQHHLVNTSTQSRATQHTRHRVLRTLRPEPV
jgi:hypothetical protein